MSDHVIRSADRREKSCEDTPTEVGDSTESIQMMENDLKRLLTYRELADILGLSHATLRKWVCTRRIPYLKLGGCVRFNAEEISRWLKKYARTPVPKGGYEK